MQPLDQFWALPIRMQRMGKITCGRKYMENLKTHFGRYFWLLRTQISLGTKDGLHREKQIQKISQFQDKVHQNTKRFLQDVANFPTYPTEDVANMVAKVNLAEWIKCVGKSQDGIKNIWKTLANNQKLPTNRRNKNSNRKCCWTHGSCF